MIPMAPTDTVNAPGGYFARRAARRPEVQRDSFAARDLGMVAAGHDMRFGPMSPASMFRGPTVQSGPGQYTVHPMMPQTGGTPFSTPRPDMGTSQYDRNMGAMGWAAQHQSPSEGSVAQVLGMRPGGDMAVRVQGFPKQPGRPNGPGYAYAPAGQIAGAFNKLAGQNPGLGLTPFNIGADGSVAGADGGAPIDPASLHSAMVQARRARGQQNIEDLRANMRQRLAVRAAQRGNFGPLTNLMKQQGAGQGAVPDDGVDHNAIFGLVGQMLQQGGDKLNVQQRTKLMQGLATAMLAGRGGAAQIPGLLGGIGDAIAGADRSTKAKGNDPSQPIDPAQVDQYRKQFPKPQDFAAFAKQSGMNDAVTNKYLYHIYGSNVGISAQDPSGNNRNGFFGYDTQIDPNQGYQPVPQGILPGIGNFIYNAVPGLFGRPPATVGPAPRGVQPQAPISPQQPPLIPGRPAPAASWGGSGRAWQGNYSGR